MMSILSRLFSSTASQPIEAIGKAVDAVFTSDDERMQAQAVLDKLAQQPHILQAEISKIEAQHRSGFVAGARPFIVWVCGISIAFSFIINPLIQWITDDAGPQIHTDAMLELVLAILGLGGLRTAEKIAGKTK